MLIGVRNLNRGQFANRELAIAFAEVATELGIESVWAADRTVIPIHASSRYPYRRDGRPPYDSTERFIEPFTWLSVVGVLNSALRLATGVLVLPLREPTIAAKQFAGLDVLSDGRAIAGVGAGWLEAEFTACHGDYASRGKALETGVEQMRLVWTGRSFLADDVEVASLPAPTSRIPIVIGGHSAAAADRAARLGDGFFPNPAPEAPRLIQLMRSRATACGRDAADVEVTVGLADDDLAILRMLNDLGVDRVVIDGGGASPDRLRDDLERRLDRLARYL